MNTKRLESMARATAPIVLSVLARRGLRADVIREFVVTEREGRVWLFAVADLTRIERLEAYTAPNVLHQMSTALRGRPVVLSNSNGLRYAILLQHPPLPTKVLYPGPAAGMVRLGVSWRGEVHTTWEDLGHVMVAGMTRSGKSVFLRLLARQALEQGYTVLAADPDGRTFGRWQGVVRYGMGPEGATRILEEAWDEWKRRAARFSQVGVDEYSEYVHRQPMPRCLVVLDEYNGMVQTQGGLRGRLAQLAQQLAWQGLKYGIHLVLAGQEWTRAVVGPVRAQMATRVVFRVENSRVSAMLLGRPGAERLRQAGRALTNTWGLMQMYYTDSAPPAMDERDAGLTIDEARLVLWLQEHAQGRMTRAALRAYGLGKREAERLRSEWRRRGLAMIRPDQDNALCLTEEAIARAAEAVARAARVAQGDPVAQGGDKDEDN